MVHFHISTIFQWVKDHEGDLEVNLVAGSCAGIATCLVGYPLDTIKVRMQMSNYGMIQNIHQIIIDGGLRGFYKGMGFPITTVPVFTAVNFTAYEAACSMFKQDESNKLNGLQIGIAGGFAGLAQSFLSTPVELTKIRLQMISQGTENHLLNGPSETVRSVRNANLKYFKQIIREEGLRFMYRGYVSTLMREVFAFGAQFYCYEMTKRAILRLENKEKNSQFDQFIAGGIGGVGCWFFSYPQDIIKTKLQMDNNVGYRYRIYKPKFMDGGFLSCSISIYNEYGLKGFYKGFSPCLLRAFVANASGFIAFEQAKKSLGRYQKY